MSRNDTTRASFISKRDPFKPKMAVDPDTTTWQNEAMNAIGDAQHAIHQGRPDIAIGCLERAVEILQRENTRG